MRDEMRWNEMMVVNEIFDHHHLIIIISKIGTNSYTDLMSALQLVRF